MAKNFKTEKLIEQALVNAQSYAPVIANQLTKAQNYFKNTDYSQILNDGISAAKTTNYSQILKDGMSVANTITTNGVTLTIYLATKAHNYFTNTDYPKIYEDAKSSATAHAVFGVFGGHLLTANLFYSSVMTLNEGHKNKKLDSDTKIASADYQVVAKYSAPITIEFTAKAVSMITPFYISVPLLIGLTIAEYYYGIDDLLETVESYTAEGLELALGNDFTASTEAFAALGMIASGAMIMSSVATRAANQVIAKADIANKATDAATKATKEAIDKADIAKTATDAVNAAITKTDIANQAKAAVEAATPAHFTQLTDVFKASILGMTTATATAAEEGADL